MERVMRNWVTTLIGLGIIVFAGVLIYQEKQTPAAMSGWFATGLLFIRSKDSIINLPKE